MGTRLLLALPVLLALAITSISPSTPASTTPPAAAPTAAPQRAPAAPPPARRPGPPPDDTCVCPQRLLWEECEPAWHQDPQAPDERPSRSRRRAAPGTQDGPV